MCSNTFCENIIKLRRVDSTNTYAENIIKNNSVLDKTAIFAYSQENGRGLGSNLWESEDRKNIIASFITYPDFLLVQQQFLLNIFISLAIKDTILDIDNKLNVSIKWPNDIYIDKKKVCGILIQNAIENQSMKYSIIGVGININQSVFLSEAPNPISLKIATGNEFDIEEVFYSLCEYMDSRYDELLSQEGQIRLVKEYLSSLFQMNEDHYYEYEGEKILARIIGIDEFGRLLLKHNEDTICCDLKEIKFIL